VRYQKGPDTEKGRKLAFPAVITRKTLFRAIRKGKLIMGIADTGARMAIGGTFVSVLVGFEIVACLRPIAPSCVH
jgi:hypothetical protein